MISFDAFLIVFGSHRKANAICWVGRLNAIESYFCFQKYQNSSGVELFRFVQQASRLSEKEKRDFVSHNLFIHS